MMASWKRLTTKKTPKLCITTPVWPISSGCRRILRTNATRKASSCHDVIMRFCMYYEFIVITEISVILYQWYWLHAKYVWLVCDFKGWSYQMQGYPHIGVLSQTILQSLLLSLKCQIVRVCSCDWHLRDSSFDHLTGDRNVIKPKQSAEDTPTAY